MMKRITLYALIAVMGLAQLAKSEGPPGICNGVLHSNSGYDGTFSNWIFRADGTTEGQWYMNTPFGLAVSYDACGTYTYSDGVAVANCNGTATIAGIGTDPYSMTINLTFPEGGDYASEGTYVVNFATWPDDDGTWQGVRYTAPITNHVFYIEIEQGWDYDEPSDDNDLAYEFEIIIETDDTVELVEFFTPAGNTFEIPNLPDQWDDVNRVWTTYGYDPCENVYYWKYIKNADTPDELDSYGDGWYSINVFYQGGGQNQTDVWFGVPYTSEYISQPTHKPTITNHTNRQRLYNPVTFEWQPCTDPNADSISLGAKKMLSGEELEIMLPVTYTSYGPSDFNDGYWQVFLSFDHWFEIGHNADGICYEVSKSSTSCYMFGIGILSELINDGIVNFEDFAKFAQGWLYYSCCESNKFCDRADLNFNGYVEYDDLQIICEDWLTQP